MDAMKVGRKLKEARGNRTRVEVAAALNISHSAIAMYESGERVPRDDLKEKMADFFGTTVGSLFFDEKVHS